MTHLYSSHGTAQTYGPIRNCSCWIQRIPYRGCRCSTRLFLSYRSALGQPSVQLEKHTETGYAWWIERIKYQLTVTDFLRIDHFRGFDRYWAVPYGEETAINGEWKPAPGLNFFTQLEANLGYHLPIIAEDLGEIDDSVIELRDKFGLPGMKILQFAFEIQTRTTSFHITIHLIVYAIQEHTTTTPPLDGIRRLMRLQRISSEDTTALMQVISAGL